MTERLPARPWDDDRLVAAFTARDRMRPLPDPLVASTLDLVAAERRPVAVRMVGRYRPALVMLAVVALVGGLAIAGWRASTGVPTDTSGPIQTAGASLPTAGPTTGPAATPSDGSSASPGDDSTTALGLPIISVSDAIGVRDVGVDDRELAVRGWFSPAGLSAGLDRFCALLLKLVPPVQNGCGDGFVWLTQDAERLGRNVGGSIEFGPPKGPAIHPSFAQIDASWWHNVPELNARSCGVRATCSASPTNIVSIVAIGHFDDRRAPLCAVNAATQCRDRFVVDRVDSVGGKPVDLSVTENVAGDRVWTVDDVRRLDPLGPDEHRLSIEVVSGRDKSLVIEPTLLDDPAWSRQPAVWLIRDLSGQRIVTHVLADGSSRVFDMHDDGTVTMLPGQLPGSHDTPWPPLGSIVIAEPEVASRPLIAVSDLSGHLIDAGSPAVATPPSSDLLERTLVLDQVTSRRLTVRWKGSPCDQRLILTVRADAEGRPDALILDGRRGSPCRASALIWTIELRFGQDVDVASLARLYRIGTGTP